MFEISLKIKLESWFEYMRYSLEKTNKARSNFNTRTNKIYNWINTIPWKDLGISNDSIIEFDEICALQECVGVAADGLVGKSTINALQKYLENQDITWCPFSGEIHNTSHLLNTQYVIWNGVRIPLHLKDESLTIIPFTHHRGLDLHHAGNFSKRTREIRSAVVHWGGLNPTHLHRVFSNRKASSHFAIGKAEDSQEIEIFQYIDLAHITWHAKGANTHSIGIDICQQPEKKHLGYYLKNGYDVSLIDNPSTLGPKKIISLDPRVKRATSCLLESLIISFGMNTHIPLADNGLISKEELAEGGVFSHFHVDFKNQGKWDVAPWWDSIVEPLVEDSTYC